ncbi:MAG: hypothetical protein F6J93_03415 [Oscillatoria sp. SIO1A7]|nr:hypothetical protein [Oscillatoria sp. SIO1A7]
MAPSKQTDKPSRSRGIFWFSSSLTFALWYGILALQKAFKTEYVVQDDARQHVFWMQRFLDSELFTGDFIADYFQSIAPAGYTALYQFAASIGLDPLLFNKLLPILLGAIAATYCFGICMELFPVPFAGFLATLLLQQSLWMTFDLVSGTPRAFAYPLFLAFLYYLLRCSTLPCLAAIALQGLFYPTFVLISAGILVLQLLQPLQLLSGGQSPKEIRSNPINLPKKNRASRRTGVPPVPFPSRDRRDACPTGVSKRLCLAGLGVAILVMLPYALKSPEFGSVVGGAEARSLPEFLPDGRNEFFHENPAQFWLIGSRSGWLPMLMPPLIWLGLFLPALLRGKSRFPLLARVKEKVILLRDIVLVSSGLFLAAHVVLFKLYLPSRYVHHSLRVVMAIAAGIAIAALFDALLQKAKSKKILLPVACLLLAVLIFYPNFSSSFPRTSYRVIRAPAIYQFFQQQPKDILIASLSGAANNIPTFSQRSVLVSPEYGISYHVGYYRQFRQRATDLIRAQYSPDLAVVKAFIQKYGIDFWLLDATSFSSDRLAKNNWLQQYQPAAEEALLQLESGNLPALARAAEHCTVFDTGEFAIVQADCIISLKLPK